MNRLGQQTTQMISRGNPRTHIANRPVRSTAEPEQNRFDDGSMVEQRVGNPTLFYPGRNDECGHAAAVETEIRKIIGGDWRGDMIVKTAVLVVNDDEQGLVPDWAPEKSLIECVYQCLSRPDVRGSTIIVGITEIAEIRINP